jgi:hypothetical protein
MEGEMHLLRCILRPRWH